jgi:hypothetical protein
MLLLFWQQNWSQSNNTLLVSEHDSVMFNALY